MAALVVLIDLDEDADSPPLYFVFLNLSRQDHARLADLHGDGSPNLIGAHGDDDLRWLLRGAAMQIGSLGVLAASFERLYVVRYRQQ
jgi:hypothetical protein